MAQRTIHYLFGDIISNQITLTDKNRFLLGSIIADAVETSDRDQSHFKIKTDTHVYYDFELFRKKYSVQIMQDDLYLGYYMHLLEDTFYRSFIYQDRFTMPVTPEEIQVLHNDYHILNAYIVSKYKIHNELEGTFALDNEPINEIATFHIDKFLTELSYDFMEQPSGRTYYLTENMLDEFIEKYISLAVDEIKNIKTGKSRLKPSDYAWLRRR